MVCFTTAERFRLAFAGEGSAAAAALGAPILGAVGSAFGALAAGLGAAGVGALACAGLGALAAVAAGFDPLGFAALDFFEAASGAAADFAPPPPSARPSTTIGEPQRLHLIRTFRPRTLSSGTAYFAGQLSQPTFMKLRFAPLP